MAYVIPTADMRQNTRDLVAQLLDYRPQLVGVLRCNSGLNYPLVLRAHILQVPGRRRNPTLRVEGISPGEEVDFYINHAANRDLSRIALCALSGSGAELDNARETLEQYTKGKVQIREFFAYGTKPFKNGKGRSVISLAKKPVIFDWMPFRQPRLS